MNPFTTYALEVSKKAKFASQKIRSLHTKEKNNILSRVCELIANNESQILEKNKLDLDYGKEKSLSSALMDRLKLDKKRIQSLIQSVQDIISLPDPIGEVVGGGRLKNGLEQTIKRVPLGVVMVIYESRPNVTIDVASLCFKSSNSCILRGGKEAFHTNQILASLFRQALRENSLPEDAVSFVEELDREAMIPFFQATNWIDIIVPRGGEALIQFVSEHSRIPVIKHDKGVCNLFIDQSADPKMVREVVVNSKVQRPGVCNSIENLIIHASYPATEELIHELEAEGVELYLSPKLLEKFPHHKLATEFEFAEEFLELKLSIQDVNHIDLAIDFIQKYSSGHTEVILSNNQSHIEKFQNSIDSAGIFVNCSSRFHDGGELGLGAEIGISTGKLHVRGPMGLKHLTTTTIYLQGNGQIRS